MPVVFHYWIVPVSSGFSVVIVEQPTESLPPDQETIGRVIIRPFLSKKQQKLWKFSCNREKSVLWD